MSGPDDFHVSFGYKGTSYDLDLVKGEKNEYIIKINGTTYTVLGEEDKLKTAYQILSSISFTEDAHLTEEDLKKKLSNFTDITSPTVEKTGTAGLSILRESPTSRQKITNSISDEITLKTLKMPEPAGTIESAYQTLVEELQVHAEKNLKKGALLVQVIGVPGSENPIIFGNLSATSTEPVDKDTVGRTGSGCKLWTALLTKIVTTKYQEYIKMDDKLGKFAPQEALKKFGRRDPEGKEIDGSELAKEITVEGLIEMTAGLEYEDQAPKHDTTETTLDQVMRGKEIKDGSIHILYDPRDKITLYSNYIALTAYPIEKAYKKVLAKENILNTNKTVGETTEGKKLTLEIQKLTLGELLSCNEAYTQGAYVYDLIDMFLADERPQLNNFTYEKILQKELFQPMKMIHSGFYDEGDSRGTAMELTFEDSKTKEDTSKPLEKEHPLVHGMSYGRTSLSDATKLTKALTGKNGLIAETDGHTLLSKDDLKAVFTSHGHNKAWGMGGVELSCGGQIVDKGGWVNQDQYSCWFDLNSGVGMIAMCNCGRRPDKTLAKFKKAVENSNYPHEKPIPKDVEGTELGIPLEDYFDHPFEKGEVEMLFDGTRGRVALLFNYDKDQEGIMHWSGTPLKVKKQKDGTFCVTTPGRFEGVIVQKIQGKHSKINYLAVSDTSFVEISKNRIPPDEDIKYAQNEFENLCGVYTNYEHPEHDPLVFTIKKNENGNMYLLAGEKGRTLVPQSIVKVEKHAISFNGHDRQPPDKIFRFVRKTKDTPWRLTVTDYISVDRVIETRDKDKKDTSQKENLETAYQVFAQELIAYAKAQLGKGALMIQVVGIEGAERPLVFGPHSTQDSSPVDMNTIGRTGSGVKLWTALLTKIMEKKYGNYFKLEDKLEKFTPLEALKKFGSVLPDGTGVPNPELAKEITVEALVAMTAGLEYDDKWPKSGPEGEQAAKMTLDQLIRGPLVKDGSIHFVCDPRDKISAYTNNIGLAAYPIEKAYKKVLTEEHFPDRSITLAATSKANTLPSEIQNLTLNSLLNCPNAYINGHYVYDLLDLFLADLEPPLNNVSYAQIMYKEFLGPMGMDHSGYQGIAGTETSCVYTVPKTGEQESVMPGPECAAFHANGYGRTTLLDASKLARELANPEGLMDKDGHLLLGVADLDDLFSPHGQYKEWGLGAVALTCNGQMIEKGGSIYTDTYDFWVDRKTGVGMIAMCNCGKRPLVLQNTFKNQVERISHPETEELPHMIEGMPIEMTSKEYLSHPLRKAEATKYYEGTRGKIAITFDWNTADEGIMHWSGTPFHVKKIEKDKFQIITPGRFRNVEVQKVEGAHIQGNGGRNEYLLVGDTSFIKTDVANIPTDEQIRYAQNVLPDLEGDYINPAEDSYGVIRFDYIEGEGGVRLPRARWLDKKSDFAGKELVPLGIVKVEKDAISFNGHDRDDAPADKIYRFKRDLTDGQWYLEVTDCASPELVYEKAKERVKEPVKTPSPKEFF